MKCAICKKQFKDRDDVIPVQQYITNERRGDFIGNAETKAVHLRCVAA